MSADRPGREPLSMRLVLSPVLTDALDRAILATGMDRSNLIRAALIEWLDRHPAWHVVEETDEEN